MALTYTPDTTDPVHLPDFDLPAVDGGRLRRADLDARATLIAFICNHCPYVRAIEDRLIALAAEHHAGGLRVVGVCSNDPGEHPEDAPAELLARWREKAYAFPYLIDARQTFARALGAVCTPDFFLFDQRGTLTYRGRLDDSWRDPARVKRRELSTAVADTLAGRAPTTPQNPSMGCSIKWLA